MAFFYVILLCFFHLFIIKMFLFWGKIIDYTVNLIIILFH